MLGYSLTVDDSLGLALIALLALPILGAVVCARVRVGFCSSRERPAWARAA